MNELEREAIILDTAWGMIDEMVNWSLFVENDGTEQTIQAFSSEPHSRLFVILLGDFLSPVQAFRGGPVPLGLLSAPPNARPSDLTFLFHLRQVYTAPQMGTDIAELRTAVEGFATWLEQAFVAPRVNLANIGVVADLRVSRYRYIKMCGNIAKHNLARLAENVKHLRRLLEDAGQPISEQDAYLALGDFFTWFHDDIFIKHSSHIAAFLNNIRWAVFEYLRPEYLRSWHRPDGAPEYSYNYHVPQHCTEPVAQAMYWNLMNRVRAKPWIQRFSVETTFERY